MEEMIRAFNMPMYSRFGRTHGQLPKHLIPTSDLYRPTRKIKKLRSIPEILAEWDEMDRRQQAAAKAKKLRPSGTYSFLATPRGRHDDIVKPGLVAVPNCTHYDPRVAYTKPNTP